MRRLWAAGGASALVPRAAAGSKELNAAQLCSVGLLPGTFSGHRGEELRGAVDKQP